MLQLVEERTDLFSQGRKDSGGSSPKAGLYSDTDSDTAGSGSGSDKLDSEGRAASISSSDLDYTETTTGGIPITGKSAVRTTTRTYSEPVAPKGEGTGKEEVKGEANNLVSLTSMSSVASTVNSLVSTAIPGSESVSTIGEPSGTTGAVKTASGGVDDGDGSDKVALAHLEQPNGKQYLDSSPSTSTLNNASKEKLNNGHGEKWEYVEQQAAGAADNLIPNANGDGTMIRGKPATGSGQSASQEQQQRLLPPFNGLKDYKSLSVVVNKNTSDKSATSTTCETDKSEHNIHDDDEEDPISPATIVPHKPFPVKNHDHQAITATASVTGSPKHHLGHVAADRVAVRHSIDSALSMDSSAVSPNIKDSMRLLRTSSNNSNASSSFSRPSVSSNNNNNNQQAIHQAVTSTPFKQPHNYSLAQSSLSTQGSGGGNYRNSASSLNSVNTAEREKEVTRRPSFTSFHRPSFSLGGRKKSSAASVSPLPQLGHPLQATVSTASTGPNGYQNITTDELQRLKDVILARREAKKKKREFMEDERVLVGTKVSEGHANFVTAYNMLTGIRVSVSRCNAKVDRELTDDDFKMYHKLAFDISGNELIPSARYDFKFKDYAPWVFRHLREMFKLDPADYLMSLTSKYIVSQLGSPGKSGSFFYFSRDFRFIIKTIHHSEHKQLRKILKDYYYHVKSNPNTLISQFYGLHRVKLPFGRKIHFIVMNNLFPPHRDIHRTYDLKGSTLGREYIEVKDVSEAEARARAGKGKGKLKSNATKPETGVVYKDINWIHNNEKIRLGPKKRKEFLNQLEIDIALLKRLNIMDYSLLLGIHDLTTGNSENIRDKTLHVFEPGSLSSSKVVELRKALAATNPTALKEFDLVLSEYDRQGFTFYADGGGYRATDSHDNPLDDIYYLGVIDCLTPYKFSKKVETFWKGLSNNRGSISAIPASEYGDRFLKFIKSVVSTDDEDSGAITEGHSAEASSSHLSNQQLKQISDSGPNQSKTAAIQAAESAHESSPLLPSVVEIE